MMRSPCVKNNVEEEIRKRQENKKDPIVRKGLSIITD